jgi:hypothetical protein
MAHDVTVVLDALPRIEAVLAKALKPRKGRPNMSHRHCAQVIVEAWRMIHGDVGCRSDNVYTACNAYWRACGGEYRGSDVDTWRRDVEWAVKADGQWIRDLFERCGP